MPTDIIKSGTQTKEVPSTELESEYSLLARQFEVMLQDADKSSGTPHLYAIWKQCQHMHNDNEMLRANMYQLQVVLQHHLEQWVDLRNKLSSYISQQTPTDECFIEKLDTAVKLSGNITNTIIKLTDATNRLKRELRATEFQSQFHIHINLFCQFMSGLNAIFFKHLRGSPIQKEVLSDVNKLAKIIDVQSQEAIVKHDNQLPVGEKGNTGLQ